MKPGQVAHVDRNRFNNEEANLAWLCLDHHDQYDSKTSQSKGLTIAELREYRTRLYRTVETGGVASLESEVAELRKERQARNSLIADHDRAIFARGDAILNEQFVNELVHTLTSDDSYSYGQYKQMRKFGAFQEALENRFLSPALRSPSERLRLSLDNLLNFLGRHFFRHGVPYEDFDLQRYALYPHMNEDRGAPNPDERIKYSRYQRGLDESVRRFKEAFKAYRVAVKETLIV